MSLHSRPLAVPPQPIALLKRAMAELLRRLLVRTGLDDHLARRTQGEPPSSFLARLAPPNTIYKAPTVRTAVREGLELELDVSDYMQWCTYYGIAIEPREILYRLAGEGMVVLDVGTNVGETLLNLARRVGSAGLVHGFEVNPTTFERCRRNVTRNGLGQIRLHHVGLGNEAGVLALDRRNVRNTGGDRLRPLASTDTESAARIPVTTLDAFVAQESITRIDLIKIDVEGFETNIVKGGRRTLASLGPTLFVELSDPNLRAAGSSPRELVMDLVALGYRLRHAETGETIDVAYDFTNVHFDVVGVPG